MPVKRRQDKRRVQLTEDQVAWLRGHNGVTIYFESPEALAELWAAHGGEVVNDWITEHPGTRPERWWQYDAPEPRQRLGGLGTPRWVGLPAIKTHLRLGVPASWTAPWEVSYYTGRARDVHGKPIGQNYAGRIFAGVALDPARPPLFEAQAAYLKRLNLLLHGEARRLKPADFEPESITDIFDFCTGD